MKLAKTILCTSLLLGLSGAASAENWSGFYIGPQISYTWMNTTTSTTDGAETDSAPTYPNGFSLGPHAGWAYQMDQWVFALEGTYSGGTFSDQVSHSDSDGYSDKTKVSQMFTIAPIVGYTQDNWMFYGKGGYASGNVEVDTYNSSGANVASDNQRQSGWLAGAGVSYKLDEKQSIGLEYDFTHLGSTDLSSAPVTMNVNTVNINSLSLVYTHYFG